MHCALYDANHCRSCQWLEKTYTQQLTDKQSWLEQPVAQWLPPITSPQQAFRNKANMVVSGSVERPVFGMVQRDGEVVDLCDCPLYLASFQPVFAALRPFIARAGLTPYNVARKRGELKYLLLTESQQGGMMLRFVLRSTTKLAQLRAALPGLQQQLPQLTVISANIQPVHMAILEGEQDIALTPAQSLAENFNGVPRWIRPQSFFQTNPQVASTLYATARQWVQQLPVTSMWDLFCGVGGFGLHCATLDSTEFATGRDAVPQLVLVNPPRRGIGAELCDYLCQMGPITCSISSCNPQTLAEDVARLNDHQISKVQLFDMFPHTAHFEVLALLTRQPR
ncbi:23S rRNA (uracil(747)-C(5))-methyltransferase [Pantoea sp. Eser]|nr:23S rRNA (uracil(747)-C(5))-methyltransferase [Pantoea sp. Eser]